ncbi:MAG: thermonuclease family protein [bacterium]|nr:thermonuclease family protein [bacterium]
MPTRLQMSNAGKFIFIIILGSVIFVLVSMWMSGNLSIKLAEFESQTCNAPEYAIVTNVIDGDTIIVDGGHWVRLLEMDADEKKERCYNEAKDRLEELVLGKEVRLQKDVSELDKYGRCLRTVFMDEQNINVQMVKEGAAQAAFYEPDVAHRQEMLAAQEDARAESRGCEWK